MVVVKSPRRIYQAEVQQAETKGRVLDYVTAATDTCVEKRIAA